MGVADKNDAVFTPFGATLLLEDSVSMKLIVSGAVGLAGYKVEFRCGEDTVEVPLVPCEGEGSDGQYKAILPGLTPTRWNSTYEITVLDGSGNAVSGTVTYSVST